MASLKYLHFPVPIMFNKTDNSLHLMVFIMLRRAVVVIVSTPFYLILAQTSNLERKKGPLSQSTPFLRNGSCKEDSFSTSVQVMKTAVVISCRNS